MTDPTKCRSVIEDEIERLIAVLDAVDGDPDREQDDPTEANGDELESTGDEEPTAYGCGWV